MLPTLNIATLANLDPRAEQTLNLVPTDAVEPVASFAASMRSSLPLWQPDDARLTLEFALPTEAGASGPGGEALPEGGKSLPARLAELVDELKDLLGLDAGTQTPLQSSPSPGVPATGNTAATAAQADGAAIAAILRHPDFPILEPADAGQLRPGPLTVRTNGVPAAVLSEVRLPPGLEFRTPLTPIEATPKDRVLPAGPVSPEPLDVTIRQVATLVDLPEDRVRTALEERAVSVADLKRVVDELKTRLNPSEPVREGLPKPPAPTARLDGVPFESRPERFRHLGVGQPSPGFVGLDVETERPVVRNDVLVAETLRQEGLLKPQSGGLQVHATSAPPLQSTSVAASPNFQPVDVKVASDAMQTPVRDPAWGERLGERVVMMANHRLQHVDIRLSPAELGPLRVSVTLDDGAASVSFVAHHAVTRDAIEQALPRLKAMLEENGIDLGQASVAQDGPRDGKAGSGEGRDGAPASTAGGDDRFARSPEQPASAPPVRLSRGLLDTFV